MKKLSSTIFLLLFGLTVASQENKLAIAKSPDFKNWPESSRLAAQEMTAKYGAPDASGPELMIWNNKGKWKTIQINRNEIKHSFPIEHTDMLQQCISYRVPIEKMAELAMFDGSVTFDRTQGLMCARCDKEINNFLALNLANDIVTGRKTVEEARKAFGDYVRIRMNGGNPEYMQKLTFSVQADSSDPDVNTTGLTKIDVAKNDKRTAGK